MNYFDKITERLAELLPECPDRQILRHYTLLVLSKGANTTMEDVHDAWTAWMVTVRPDHKSLIPFNELPSEIQEYDREKTEIIHKVAYEMRGYS